MTLGEFLKQNRQENKLTQQQLAEKMCVSVRTIRRYETEYTNPRLDKLCRFFFHLGIKIQVTPCEGKK